MSIFDVTKVLPNAARLLEIHSELLICEASFFFLRGRGEAIFFSFLTILNSNFILKQFQTSSRDFIFSRRAAFVLR